RRAPGEAVASRILLVVRLDLDDHSAYAVEEQRRADQLGCDLVHRAREELRRELRQNSCCGPPGFAVDSSRRLARRPRSARSPGPVWACWASRSARSIAWSTSWEPAAASWPMSWRIVRSVREATIGSAMPSTQTCVRLPLPRRASEIGSSA